MERKPMQQVTKTHKQLRCKLSDAELIEFGERLALNASEQYAQEERATAVKAQLKSEMAALEAEGARLAGIVRARHDIRDVEVAVIRDYSTAEYMEIRTDTDEVIIRRPLQDNERQLDLVEANEAEGSVGNVLKVDEDGEAYEGPEDA